MLIHPNYTPIQIISPDDGKCGAIYHIWDVIYKANLDTYSYISHLSLIRTYNLIYSLIKTDNLNLLNYPYIVIPTSSAENINYYKLIKNNQLLLKEENNIQEIVNNEATQYWYKDGKQHRDNDLPSVIYLNGTKYWYKDGNFHRDKDLPAVILSDGTQKWYKDGERHRDNGLPAIIYPSGERAWYKNDKKCPRPS